MGNTQSLARLMALKNRMVDVARGELRQAAYSLEAQENALVTYAHHTGHQRAEDLTLNQAARDAGYKRLPVLAEQVAVRQGQLQEAKKEARQIELLLEKARAKDRAQKDRREKAAVEDWVQARQARSLQ